MRYRHTIPVLLTVLAALGATACGPSGEDERDAGGNQNDNDQDAAVLWDGYIYHFDGGGTDAMKGCDPKSFVLQQAPPAEVYLVVDRSGSMLEPGSTVGMTKWDELIAAVDAALTQYEGAIRFGLLTYPVDAECTTSGPQVGLGLRNRVPILEHLQNDIPAGGTPTAAALNNAAWSMMDLGSPVSPKVMILATDGGPNCNYFLESNPSCSCSYADPDYCCTNHPGDCLFGNTCLDDEHTLDVIQDWRDNHSIDTFVIGLEGTAEYVSLLNAMATTGGRPQQGGTTDYYSASNQTELLTALQTIAVGLISCEIELEEPPDLPDGVHVYMDGHEVDRDPARANGWNYTDASNMVIKLYGPACDTLQDGDEHTLTATFACVVD